MSFYVLYTLTVLKIMIFLSWFHLQTHKFLYINGTNERLYRPNVHKYKEHYHQISFSVHSNALYNYCSIFFWKKKLVCHRLHNCHYVDKNVYYVINSLWDGDDDDNDDDDGTTELIVQPSYIPVNVSSKKPTNIKQELSQVYLCYNKWNSDSLLCIHFIDPMCHIQLLHPMRLAANV